MSVLLAASTDAPPGAWVLALGVGIALIVARHFIASLFAAHPFVPGVGRRGSRVIAACVAAFGVFFVAVSVLGLVISL